MNDCGIMILIMRLEHKAEGARHIKKDIPWPLFVSQADTLL